MKMAEAWWPKHYPVPAGYVRTNWGEVREGDEVYLLFLRPPEAENGPISGTWAKGPFAVGSVERRQLLGESGLVLSEAGDTRLLRRVES